MTQAQKKIAKVKNLELAKPKITEDVFNDTKEAICNDWIILLSEIPNWNFENTKELHNLFTKCLDKPCNRLQHRMTGISISNSYKALTEALNMEAGAYISYQNLSVILYFIELSIERQEFTNNGYIKLLIDVIGSSVTLQADFLPSMDWSFSFCWL